ncbi:MAG TPA: wax ester/triacylglycerol synthase domain-containing protein [Solirubrobacteraceae bacterium]|jgi:WS/DGAT/MGAT family acyltransferase
MVNGSTTGGSSAGLEPRRLSAEDLSILALEDETVAGHTCKVIVLDGPIDLERLRASIRSRLDRVPELSERLSQIDGEPCWVPDSRVDLRAHVVGCERVEPANDTGLATTAARIFERRLDRSRPLWRINVVSELDGGRSALIWRIHHALADGATAMRMVRGALWDEERVADVREATSGQRPAAPKHVTAAARHRFGALRAAAREVPQPWMRSPFDGHIDAHREVAFATVELERLRRMAKATDGATVNDVVLAVIAGGLRRWLEAHHGHLGAVRVKVPVSLHEPAVAPARGVATPGNRDSFFCLDLPLEGNDPLARLDAIRSATRVRKQEHDAEHLDALMRRLGRAPGLRRFAERVLAHPRSFALNVSNVPGPRKTVRVLGLRVDALYSLAEIRRHHALRIAVVSLADTLNFGLVADPTLLPDVDALASAIQLEAGALSARLTPV